MTTDFQYGLIVGIVIGAALLFFAVLAFNYAETPTGRDRP